MGHLSRHSSIKSRVCVLLSSSLFLLRWPRIDSIALWWRCWGRKWPKATAAAPPRPSYAKASEGLAPGPPKLRSSKGGRRGSILEEQKINGRWIPAYAGMTLIHISGMTRKVARIKRPDRLKALPCPAPGCNSSSRQGR